MLNDEGQHGSTYGGNPLGCAVAMTALQILKEENLVERAFTLGVKFRQALLDLKSPLISLGKRQSFLFSLVFFLIQL